MGACLRKEEKGTGEYSLLVPFVVSGNRCGKAEEMGPQTAVQRGSFVHDEYMVQSSSVATLHLEKAFLSSCVHINTKCLVYK